MANTPRTQSALLALAPDNSAGQITAQVLRDFMVSVYNNQDAPGLDGAYPRPQPRTDLALGDRLAGSFLSSKDELLTLVQQDQQMRRVTAYDLATSLSSLTTRTIGTLGGLALWCRSDGHYTTIAQTTASVNRGDSVASWYDRSGNSRHPQNTQLSGGTLIPDYSETGRATILTGSSVTLGSNSVGTALQGAWCAYLVFAQPATSGTFTAAFSVGSASDSNYAYLSLRRTDLGSTRNRFGWPGGGTGYLDDTQDVGGGLVIYAVGYDGTNWKYRANGGSWTSVAGDAFSTANA
jgi:hypothetical protein